MKKPLKTWKMATEEEGGEKKKTVTHFHVSLGQEHQLNLSPESC